MKNLLTFLTLLFLSSQLIGQIGNVLQFEVGMGMNNSHYIESDFPQAISLNGTISYQLRSFALGLRYEHAVSTLGVEGISSLIPNFNGIRARESEFSRYKSLQLRLDYCPNLENFKPIFGIGFGRVFLNNETTYYDNFLFPIEKPSDDFPGEKRRFNALVLHFGYKVKNMRYGITLLPTKRKDTERVIGTSISYSFGLSKRKSESKYELALNHNWKSNPVLLRVEYGRSLLVPLQGEYAASARYFISAQILAGKNFYLGFTSEEVGHRLGFDKNTIDVKFISDAGRFNIRKTNVTTGISAFKVYVHKFKSIARNTDLFYGGGMGVYKINEVGEERVFIHYYPPVIESSRKLGLLISGGVRTGWFSNKVEVNIPFDDIPIYIGLQTAVGIQIRKRTQKGKAVLFPIDDIPQE